MPLLQEQSFHSMEMTEVDTGIAAPLVIYSHAEAPYPAHWTADGGQIGVALLFHRDWNGDDAITRSSKLVT